MPARGYPRASGCTAEPPTWGAAALGVVSFAVLLGAAVGLFNLLNAAAQDLFQRLFFPG